MPVLQVIGNGSDTSFTIIIQNRGRSGLDHWESKLEPRGLGDLLLRINVHVQRDQCQRHIFVSDYPVRRGVFLTGQLPGSG